MLDKPFGRWYTTSITETFGENDETCRSHGRNSQ